MIRLCEASNGPHATGRRHPEEKGRARRDAFLASDRGGPLEEEGSHGGYEENDEQIYLRVS